MFHFKQFSVDQTGCAMKINTDGVLLGAFADADEPKTILDIGTGTGVIALMLAQRFINALIDAVEIDALAAQTAAANFQNSPFARRLSVFPIDFEQYFDKHPDNKFDLIVSNPPFYINSLESPKAKKKLAKHAEEGFFEVLINGVARHLTQKGLFWLILPLQAADVVKELAHQHKLYPHRIISVQSFKESAPHREIICFGFADNMVSNFRFIIYDTPKIYSAKYQDTLKDFFTIFS